MSVTLLLTTIAAQVGSAYFNSKRSKAQSAELAEQQQRLEEKIMLQGIENSREEYVQACALQREIEQLMQKDRLELIQQNYLNSIELDAYNVSLEHWPLFTPPYVIKGQLIDGLSGVNSTDAIPLSCIMTTSMHTKFNQKIFPQLEENLALFCSKHWNSSQRNSIRFYQNAWRDNIVDLGSRIKDLYAHLDDIPTIVLSPVVRNGKITFKIYWWGISKNTKDQHYNDYMLYDPELPITFTDDLELQEEQIEQIIEELSNKISILISFFADQYYWNFYNYAPLLPSILSMNSTKDSCADLEFYEKAYAKAYKDLIGENLSNISYRAPHIVDFLGSLVYLGALRPYMSDLIKDLLLKIYHIRTGVQVNQLSDLDSSKLCMDNKMYLELKRELKTEIAKLKDEVCPVGTIQAFAFNRIPNGWMICDGRSLDPEVHSELFSAIGTTFGGDGKISFAIPDLRGRFIRGWSTPKGDIDKERQFGSEQSDALQNHQHQFNVNKILINSSGEHSHTARATTIEINEGMLNSVKVLKWLSSSGRDSAETSSNGGHNHQLTLVSNPISNAINANCAHESRPVNIALLYCIKVGLQDE